MISVMFDARSFFYIYICLLQFMVHWQKEVGTILCYIFPFLLSFLKFSFSIFRYALVLGIHVKPLQMATRFWYHFVFLLAFCGWHGGETNWDNLIAYPRQHGNVPKGVRAPKSVVLNTAYLLSFVLTCCHW